MRVKVGTELKRCHKRIFCSEIEVFLVKKGPYKLYIRIQTVKDSQKQRKYGP